MPITKDAGLRRAAGPVSVAGTMARIEIRGSVMLGAAVALSAAGLLRVDGVLLALGVAGILFLGLGWGLGRRNLGGLRVEVEGPEVVQAGAPVRFGIAVFNGRRLVDAFGLGMELRGPGGLVAECRVPWVAAGSAADLDLRTVVPGRGSAAVIEVVVSSEFPLGLLRFSRVLEVGHRLVVLPRPLAPVELTAAGDSQDAEFREAVAAGDSSGEPHGLRPYRAGDRARSIAWPATVRSRARGGGVLVREVDPPGYLQRRVVLLFHSFGADGSLIRPDRFERALGLVWGALGHFQAHGVVVELRADFEQWRPRRVANRRQLGQAGAMLAEARRAAGTEAHEVQGRIAELDPNDALVIVSDMPPDAWKVRLGPPRGSVVVDVGRYEESNPWKRRA